MSHPFASLRLCEKISPSAHVPRVILSDRTCSKSLFKDRKVPAFVETDSIGNSSPCLFKFNNFHKSFPQVLNIMEMKKV